MKATYAPLEVNPVTPCIGAEVRQVDLCKPLPSATLAALRRAWHDYGVLFFRDQPISRAQQVALGRQLGEPFVMPVSGQNHPEHPELFHFFADEKATYAAGEGWHADVTASAEPPLGGLYVLDELPAVGGDTLFLSAHEAYRRLSPAMKGFLRGLTAEHNASRAWSRVSYATPQGGFPSAVHPVVIRHPVTGRESLYVNSQYTVRIVELTRLESDAVLGFLFRHLETPEFACRFRWQPGSVVLWDNRAVQHCALFDYSPQRRSGWRYAIRGDRPQAA